MKPRVEFLYTHSSNKTTVYVWVGQKIVDQLVMNGVLTKYTEEKVTKELKEKYEKKMKEEQND